MKGLLSFFLEALYEGNTDDLSSRCLLISWMVRFLAWSSFFFFFLFHHQLGSCLELTFSEYRKISSEILWNLESDVVWSSTSVAFYSNDSFSWKGGMLGLYLIISLVGLRSGLGNSVISIISLSLSVSLFLNFVLVHTNTHTLTSISQLTRVPWKHQKMETIVTQMSILLHVTFCSPKKTFLTFISKRVRTAFLDP